MKAESLSRTVARLKEMWEELRATGYVKDHSYDTEEAGEAPLGEAAEAVEVENAKP